MKDEAEFNGIVSKSLNENGFGFKIPDTVSMYTMRHADLPYDGFGIYKDNNGIGHPLYWESKFLHRPESFNFGKLADHQIMYLLKCQKLLPESMVLFLVCVDFGRADKRVYFFRDMEYIDKRKKEKKNIFKKEFENRKNYVTIKKGLIDFEEILNAPKEVEYAI